MAEININEYVRDRDGYIIKVNNIVPDKDSEDIWYEEKILNGTWKSMIVKHSKNIIDLIEVGDYVNGYKVVVKNGDLGELVLREDTGFLYINKGNNISKIKSIVTKEQFQSIEYKVEE